MQMFEKGHGVKVGPRPRDVRPPSKFKCGTRESSKVGPQDPNQSLSVRLQDAYKIRDPYKISSLLYLSYSR